MYNVIIAGINNEIKALNHVAYGFRNFNFRNYKYQILLHFKLRSVESK
ncbi:transposase [Amphibacillus cookii]|nr:transposase [Amphibacillus cookii]MBM7540738.1 transposase [Amphibacillus cookii]